MKGWERTCWSSFLGFLCGGFINTLQYSWQTTVDLSSSHMFWLSFGIFKIFKIIWDAYISFRIFKVCKTIIVVHICNGQLKICGPFIFNRTVLHLVIVTKYGTNQSIYFKYYRLTHFQLSIEYAGISYCFANFKYVEGYVNISYQLNYYKYVKG